MNRFINTLSGFIGRNTVKTLAAAALSVCALAPIAQGRDRDKDVNVGVRADDRGNVDFGLSFLGRDRRPAPRVERVWVDPVWVSQADRVWVDAVYEKACDRAWCEPITKDAVTKIWVEPTFEVRETTTYVQGRKVTSRDRVQVAPGHYEERHSAVVVAEGHWNNVEKWVLKCDGHWENHDRWVCASEGHWEDHELVPVRTERVDRIDLHFGGR